MSKSHYAVRRGRKTGVFSTWAETYAAVNGFTGAQHRKFGTRADADLWLSGVEVSKPAPPSKKRRIAPEQRAFGAVPKKPRLDSSAAHTTAGEAGQPTQCVYCDGGCEANGTAEARASIGVWFGEGDARNCSELLPPAQRQTSQSAELWAAIVALRAADPARALLLRTDSRDTIRAATQWRIKWKELDWVKPQLKNLDLYKQLSDALDARSGETRWEHVRGHRGERGNEEADRLATEARSRPRGGGGGAEKK
jgi:ribonuclease HI